MCYSIDEKNRERQHLLACYLNPLTLNALESIPVKRGASILDLGCGLGETTLMLSKRFPGSRITAVDQDSSLLEVARSRNYEQALATTFEQVDARQLPFPNNQFDFVFTRALLHHLSAPLLALQEMKRVAKRGGIVFAQEPDMNFRQSFPENWAYPQLLKFASQIIPDILIGRKLISYFRFVLFENIVHDAQVLLADENSTLKRLFTITAEALSNSLIEKGLVDANHMLALIAECKKVEEDKSNIVLASPMIAVWGTRT